jgi:AraC-like DNA-binding protein
MFFFNKDAILLVFFTPAVNGHFSCKTWKKPGIEEVRSRQSLYQLKACSGILVLIAEVLALERRMKQPNCYQKTVEEAKYFMDSNIFSAIDVADISEHIGVSTSRLNEIFKTYKTGMTPSERKKSSVLNSRGPERIRGPEEICKEYLASFCRYSSART